MTGTTIKFLSELTFISLSVSLLPLSHPPEFLSHIAKHFLVTNYNAAVTVAHTSDDNVLREDILTCAILLAFLPPKMMILLFLSPASTATVISFSDASVIPTNTME